MKDENYLRYTPADLHSEMGLVYSIKYCCTHLVYSWVILCYLWTPFDTLLDTTRLSLCTSFDQQTAGAVLDLDGDEGTGMKRSKSQRKWYVCSITVVVEMCTISH